MLDIVQVWLDGCHNTSTMNAYLCLTYSSSIVAGLSQYFNYECQFMLDMVQVLLHGHNILTMNAYLCST